LALKSLMMGSVRTGVGVGVRVGLGVSVMVGVGVKAEPASWGKSWGSCHSTASNSPTTTKTRAASQRYPQRGEPLS